MNTPKLLPSLMCVDFSRMAQTLEVFEQCGIDALHVDIMDGEFVPNYALGTDFCRQLRKLTPIPLDIRLMISRPDTISHALRSSRASMSRCTGRARRTSTARSVRSPRWAESRCSRSILRRRMM